MQDVDRHTLFLRISGGDHPALISEIMYSPTSDAPVGVPKSAKTSDWSKRRSGRRAGENLLKDFFEFGHRLSVAIHILEKSCVSTADICVIVLRSNCRAETSTHTSEFV